MRNTRIAAFSIWLLALSLLLAACGNAAPTATATRPPATGPAATSAAPTATPLAPTATARPTATQPPPPTATPAPVSAGELTFTDAALDNEYNPALRGGGSHSGMYTYLMDTKPEGVFDPDGGLITSYSPNADSSVWTFKLRTNIQFHNGDKATSTDFKYGLDRAIDPQSGWAQAADIRKTIKSLATPDDATLVVNLNGPDIFWPISFVSRNRVPATFPNVIVSGKYTTSQGDTGAARAPIGSGPYKFKSLAPGDRVIREAVDYKHFFFGTPRVKTLTTLAIPESATRLALVKTGAADFTAISGSQVDEVKASGRNVVVRKIGKAARMYSAQFPNEIPGYGRNPLTIKAVRQAMYLYSIDRKALVSSFLRGYGVPSMDYPVGKTDLYAYVPQPVPDYDPVKAKALLAGAGYPNGFEIDFWMGTQSALPEAMEIMEAIAVWWEGVGIKVNRIPFTGAAFTQAINANYQKGWPKPTFWGLSYSGNLKDISTATAALQNNPASIFHVDNDPEGLRMANLMASAKTIDEYKTAAINYQKYLTENLNMFLNLFEADDLYATSSKVAKTWQLGRDSSTIRIEAAAALP